MRESDLRQRAFAFAVYDNEGLFADNYLNDLARINESRFNVGVLGIWICRRAIQGRRRKHIPEDIVDKSREVWVWHHLSKQVKQSSNVLETYQVEVFCRNGFLPLFLGIILRFLELHT